MDTVRQGLRAGEIDKDTYGRLECSTCGVRLGKREAEEGMGYVQSCSECGRSWRRLD